MLYEVGLALQTFTERYVDGWQQQYGHFPASETLFGIPSPCICGQQEERVLWSPQPFTLEKNLHAVERALDICIHEDVSHFYTTQFAGDMLAETEGYRIELIQVWNEADFIRLQENLIGHLVMKRRLKEAPTLFIATTSFGDEIISINNITAEVMLEQPGTAKSHIIASNVAIFLESLQPVT
ncbi:SecY-interacting protein [Enterobacteriaceae bacterium LUAb1]